ncbi:MAG: pilus assembly protein PilP [Burkholderiales bacterium]
MIPRMHMRTLIALTAASMLAACGGEQHSDLRAELEKMTKDMRGRVDPLPTVTPYQPVPYEAEKEVDPFRPERIEVAQAGQAKPSAGSARIKAEQERPKEPLEAFPLESIQMQGTLTQGKETFGLVKAGSNLYRVRKGMYMGQNFGVIMDIDEVQISLKELVQDGGGDWIERQSALQLQEGRK